MASGYKVKSGGVDVDLDDWFDPYVQGTKPALTGYKAGSQDLRDRYAPLVYGTKAALTSYNVTGVGDLRELFAAKGTAAYKLPFDGESVIVGEVLTNGQTGYAYAQLTLQADGNYTLQTVRSPNPAINDTDVVSQGVWNTLGGAASGYQVRYTLSNISTTGSGGTSTSNAAAAFAPLSVDRAVYIRVDGGYHNGSRSIEADLKVELKRISDGLVFSTTNAHLLAHCDGSV